MFLKKFDYLSYPLTLYFNNYSSHSSIISGIITIITYLLCFILTIYVSKDFLFKENPNAYHYVEVMSCAGGCIGGGGQPYGVTDEVRAARTKALYTDDEKCTIRQSHNNPEIAAIYKDFLGEPLGHKSHELLHTSYEELDLYR